MQHRLPCLIKGNSTFIRTHSSQVLLPDCSVRLWILAAVSNQHLPACSAGKHNRGGCWRQPYAYEGGSRTLQLFPLRLHEHCGSSDHCCSASSLVKVTVLPSLTSQSILSGGQCCNITLPNPCMFHSGQELTFTLRYPAGTNCTLPSAPGLTSASHSSQFAALLGDLVFLYLQHCSAELWLRAAASTTPKASAQSLKTEDHYQA